MKKIILSSVFIFILFLVFKNNFSLAANRVTDARCLTITGTFTAKNWSGGPMMVGCGGDNGKVCKGDTASVKPGKKFTLTRCSCPPYANGCLVIGKKVVLKNDGPNKRPRARVIGDKVPAKCSISHKKNVCGVNGIAITVNFKVTCNAPRPTDTPTTTITNTPTPTSSVCPVPNPVLNIKITCPNCNNVTPSITPTVTPASTFCGGIAGVKCPSGYVCNNTNDPDSSGTCEIAPTRGSSQ